MKSNHLTYSNLLCLQSKLLFKKHYFKAEEIYCVATEVHVSSFIVFYCWLLVKSVKPLPVTVLFIFFLGMLNASYIVL